MEPEFAQIAKEEILRNVIKTHSIVLLLGWHGVGKTASSLRAVRGLWKPYYLKASGGIAAAGITAYNSEVVLLGRLDELPAGPSSVDALIIDDFDMAPEEIVSAVNQFITQRNFPGKIVIIAEAQAGLEEAGLRVDAVVRMKEDTAQILYTCLREI